MLGLLSFPIIFVLPDALPECYLGFTKVLPAYYLFSKRFYHGFTSVCTNVLFPRLTLILPEYYLIFHSFFLPWFCLSLYMFYIGFTCL